ncbi:30S ribosomal protein S3 [Candidatus Woesearchaeota archaeon]|nr:30S ribosomal protein S3 [Candidatus Woesearchaeota archaeon]
MIERKFVSEKLKEFMIGEHVNEKLKHAGQSEIKLKKTPLGEKLIITASRPGLVVGRKGENIKVLTSDLKKKFKLDNPQIEIEEVENQFMDSRIMADKIAMTLERFGAARFKSIGYRVLTDIMNAGALGAEILISGKIPSARAKRWRFYQGYLKKSGSVAVDGVLTSYTIANLKTGVVGIQVRIMPANLELPDKIDYKQAPVLEDVTDKKVAGKTEELSEEVEDKAEKSKKVAKKATKKVAKKATKKTAKKLLKK